MQVHRCDVFTLVVCAVLVPLARPASAQPGQAPEVTPFVALGTAGASPVGVSVTVPVTSTLSVESEMGYRRGEGDLHALSSSVSLLHWLPRLGPTTPYVAAGIGLAQHGLPVFGATGEPVGTHSRVALTVNAGGGMRMRMTDAVSLRTDVRWFQAVGGHKSEQFRVSQGLSFGVASKGGARPAAAEPEH